MGSIGSITIKNIRQLRYSMKKGTQSYTFAQRKGDRLITTFIGTCLANVLMFHLINLKEQQICNNYDDYMNQIRQSGHITPGNSEKE